MFKKIFYSTLLVLAGYNSAIAQTDSTDLSVYMSEPILESELDSMLYGGGSFELLQLDFTITDTVAFAKVHISLTTTESGTLIFKKVYPLSELTAEALIEDWAVSFPFGNLENTESYTVAIMIESYDGSLSPTITKTLNP